MKNALYSTAQSHVENLAQVTDEYFRVTADEHVS